jgi:hypothetical protein
MLLATLVLLVAGAALGLALTAGAAPLGALDDTTTPTPTQPTPDPAPPAPKPKPATKPVSKPAPKRTYTPPKSTYTAPTRTYSTPTYTPSPSSVKPPVTHKVRKHKVRTHKKAVVTTTPTETTPAPASVIPPAIPVGHVTRSSGNAAVAGTLFIAGVTFAALLFLLAAAVPGTSARFTPVGRVVIEHQQELVLVGVGAFVITVFVYLITGHGL